MNNPFSLPTYPLPKFSLNLYQKIFWQRNGHGLNPLYEGEGKRIALNAKIIIPSLKKRQINLKNRFKILNLVGSDVTAIVFNSVALNFIPNSDIKSKFLKEWENSGIFWTKIIQS